MARSGLQVANLGFQRGPGQELAENGPFAFKPHKEFIEKNTAFILEHLAFKTVQMTILASKRSFLASKWPILASNWPIRGAGRGQEEARKRPGRGQKRPEEEIWQNPARLQGGTLTQKRPPKTKNDLKRCFLRANLWLPGPGLYLGGFRVLTFLIERCCGHQGLYERGCTPPIGAKPCSCTCCARP